MDEPTLVADMATGARASAPVSGGQYLAVPYNPFIGNPARNEIVLEGCVNLPLFPLPYDAHERKVAIAGWLTNPEHLFWEVYRGERILGILGLTRIVRGLDALAHLAFFDRQLLGRRQLVLNMMDWAFRELALQRLSVEIPEHLDPLIRFCRAKLGFKYEGEVLAERQVQIAELSDRRINSPARWVARWGARREHMYYDGTTWHDVVLLRLLRAERDLMR